jgi:CelD/BcsL family acetyltransferase involved in cellulose biosynthesis
VRLEAGAADAGTLTDRISVHALAELDAIRDLEPAHQRLFTAADVPHVGASFAYLIADAVTASPGSPWQVFAAWRGSELAGCLHGRRVDGKFRGVPVATFQVGSRLVADPLIVPAGRDAVLQRLLEEIVEAQSDCATLLFPRLSESGYLQVSRAATALGLPWQWRWSTYAYAFDATVGLDAFLANLDGDHRRELRRRGRRLAREHGTEFRRESGSGEDADAERLERFAALEDSGWKGRESTSIRRRPGYPQYFSELVRSASRAGMLAWYTLVADDLPIAMYMTLRSGGTQWLPKIGYDERFAVNCPGMLLTHHLLTEACADPAIDRIENISAAPWVRSWAPMVVPFRSITLFSPSARGKLLHRAQAARETLQRLTGRVPRAPGPGDRPFI